MEYAGAIFVLGLLALIALTGVAAIYVKVILPAQMRARRAQYAQPRQGAAMQPLSTLAPSPGRDYVATPPVRRAETPVSVASRQEAEVEVRREVKPEGDMGIVTMTEKALQSRLDDTYQQAAIETFAVLLKAGYLEQAVRDRKLSELKRLVFQVSGGRQLQALNAAIDAVPVPLDEPAPRATPLAGRELAADVEFPRPR